jgi:thiol-disulfide isomerase/thioredoxin
MSRLSSYRTLLAGLVAPFAAAGLGFYVYRTLTRASTDRDADFVFRLSVVAIAMAVPGIITLVLGLVDRKKGAFGAASKVGLLLGVLSLGLVFMPVRGLIARSKQAQNLALSDVEAPPFSTVDIHGTTHSLDEHQGKVVLLNIWATWCPPCRKEMPELDELYRERKDQGLVVYGLSTEDVDTQLDFEKNVLSVSYPLLTVDGNVPEIYKTTARYPANYLIDREGRLQAAPSTEQPFENLVAAVDTLLNQK